MDYLVCPEDGTKLKAVADRVPGSPLLVSCPMCGSRFTFGAGGLRPAPAPDGPAD